MENNNMVTRKSWNEFRESEIMWMVNTILQVFGWSIVVEMDDDKVTDVYPARVKYRGFTQKTNSKGYIKLSNYMQENADELLKEAIE